MVEETPDGKETPDDNKEGLSGGAIAAIVIGSIAVVGGGSFSIFWFVVQKKSMTAFVTATKDIALNLVGKFKKLFTKSKS